MKVIIRFWYKNWNYVYDASKFQNFLATRVGETFELMSYFQYHETTPIREEPDIKIFGEVTDIVHSYEDNIETMNIYLTAVHQRHTAKKYFNGFPKQEGDE